MGRIYYKRGIYERQENHPEAIGHLKEFIRLARDNKDVQDRIPTAERSIQRLEAIQKLEGK